jgi:hypothetical protein
MILLQFASESEEAKRRKRGGSVDLSRVRRAQILKSLWIK